LRVNILIVGSGVIGTVYGAQLGAAGHAISVLEHGDRTDVIAARGLYARDVSSGVETHAPVRVVAAAGAQALDVVLVAVRRDHLPSVAGTLSEIPPNALVLFMGNNPAGRSSIPAGSGTRVALGFPGVGGAISAGVATYYKIAQQPTAIEASDEPRLAALADACTARGLPVQRVADMDGWLAYHTVFIASICAALYRCGTDPKRLAHSRATLKLMCLAITQGFHGLRGAHVEGCPRNLRVLHSRWLMPVATRYWARAMRSPMGELAFAAHARHAEPEMRALASDVITRLGRADATATLRALLAPQP
jgi:2-dehydropantoate 2-reductase